MPSTPLHGVARNWCGISSTRVLMHHRAKMKPLPHREITDTARTNSRAPNIASFVIGPIPTAWRRGGRLEPVPPHDRPPPWRQDPPQQGHSARCPFRKPYPGRIRRNDRIGACSRVMVILRLLIGALRDCIMSRGRLEAEVIVLRHQLNILRRQSPRQVRPNAFDRAVFACLYRYFPDIANAVAIIRPETVIRWHRMGFRAWWR